MNSIRHLVVTASMAIIGAASAKLLGLPIPLSALLIGILTFFFGQQLTNLKSTFVWSNPHHPRSDRVREVVWWATLREGVGSATVFLWTYITLVLTIRPESPGNVMDGIVFLGISLISGFFSGILFAIAFEWPRYFRQFEEYNEVELYLKVDREKALILRMNPISFPWAIIKTVVFFGRRYFVNKKN